MRHQCFHLTQPCLIQLVPVREVRLLRDLQVQEVMVRADSLLVTLVHSLGRASCPGESRSRWPVAALWTHPRADVCKWSEESCSGLG